MTKKKYRLVLFFLITFFCVFDGMRSNIVLNQIISPLKELSIVLCFIECLKLKKIQMKYVLGIPLFSLFLYHILISVVSLLQGDSLNLANTILMSFKFSLIYFTCVAFYHFEELTGKPYSRVLTWVVWVGLFYTFLNIISVFVNLPIWIKNDIWFGRFSKGYPTSDTISLSLMFLIVLFNALHFKTKKRICFILLSVVSIMMQNTGSGLILLPFIVLVYIIGECYTRKVKNVMVFAFSLLIAVAIVGKFLTSMNQSVAQKVEDATLVFQAKIDNFIKGEETDNFNSIEARKDAERDAMKFVHTDWEKLCGIGLGHFTMDEKLMNSRAFSIENMTSNIKVIYGYIGIILYWLSILSFLFFIGKWKTDILTRLFYGCGIAIFVVGSQALVSFYLIQVYGSFAIIIGALKNRKNIGKL